MKGEVRDKRVLVGSEFVIEKVYVLDGQVVTKEEFEVAFPDREVSADFGVGSLHSGWPIKSEGAAVHPKQREEAIASAKAKGVPTYFDRAGRPVFTSRAHQLAYLKAYNMHNRSDHAGGNGNAPKPTTPEYV
jgi:hypothetical protein